MSNKSNAKKSSLDRPGRSRREKQLARAMLQMLKHGVDVRSRKARRLRAAIRVDRYENDLKFQIAMDRLLDEVRSGG